VQLDPAQVRPEWLQLGPIPSLEVTFAMTVSLMESGLPDNVVERLALNPPPKVRTEWAAFVAQVIEGDEVWYFRSPSKQLDGRAGFAIVRAGLPVATYVTSMS
jgi:hypothetical protein